MSLFESYPNDPHHIPAYISYQARYAKNARESDKAIIKILTDLDLQNGSAVLDIGCSTGNLLRHIRAGFPKLTLTGGELSDDQLKACRSDGDLAAIKFERLDVLDLPADSFDVVIANAILYGFSDGDFETALVSIAKSLRPSGCLIAFDFFHHFDQDLAIIEKTSGFPNGHPLHFRSFATAQRALGQAGFARGDFTTFQIPIDLAAANEAPIQTRTEKTAAGDRIMFRGALAQPWCHLLASL